MDSLNDNVTYRSNYTPGMVQSLAIPTGIAINTGLGLMTPFGGADGYKAAMPSEEDPTTSNVVGEIALKYIMGRTGNYFQRQFVVRPSKPLNTMYRAFKYDKAEDYNPFDGDFSLLLVHCEVRQKASTALRYKCLVEAACDDCRYTQQRHYLEL